MTAMLMQPSSALRGATAHLAESLHAGHVYRREDLARLSNSVDRHLRELVTMGKLQKLAQGLYHAPKKSNFGPLPPSDEQVVKSFLRDKDFLVFSPSRCGGVFAHSIDSIFRSSPRAHRLATWHSHWRHRRPPSRQGSRRQDGRRDGPN